MKTQEELLAAASPRPCPWCGFVPNVVQATNASDWYLVTCDRNDLCEMMPSLERETVREAIAAWNQRSPEYAALVECDRLLRRLDTRVVGEYGKMAVRDALAAVDKAREDK